MLILTTRTLSIAKNPKSLHHPQNRFCMMETQAACRPSIKTLCQVRHVIHCYRKKSMWAEKNGLEIRWICVVCNIWPVIHNGRWIKEGSFHSWIFKWFQFSKGNQSLNYSTLGNGFHPFKRLQPSLWKDASPSRG